MWPICSETNLICKFFIVSVSNLFCIFLFSPCDCLFAASCHSTDIISKKKWCNVLSNLISTDALPPTICKIHRILCSLPRVAKSSLIILLELVLLQNISTDHFCYLLLLSVCFCMFIFSSNILNQGCMEKKSSFDGWIHFFTCQQSIHLCTWWIGCTFFLGPMVPLLIFFSFSFLFFKLCLQYFDLFFQLSLWTPSNAFALTPLPETQNICEDY